MWYTYLMGPIRHRCGQTALEYLLLFAIVAAAVLFSFKNFLPQVRNSSEGYYNSVTRVIMGENPRPIDGGWCPWEPCVPSVNGVAGTTTSYRTCQCPTPAFGGADCPGAGNKSCP